MISVFSLEGNDYGGFGNRQNNSRYQECLKMSRQGDCFAEYNSPGLIENIHCNDG
jgi:hypothetical protein